MIARISLKEAEAALFNDGRTRRQRTFYKDMRRGLAAQKVKYADRVQRHRSWREIKDISLVKCGLNEDNEWHWVVYDGTCGMMYDPLAKMPRKPDGRSRRVSSHLPIIC
jgi:hypothetical protein